MKTLIRLALFLFLSSCGWPERNDLKYLQVRVGVDYSLVKYLDYPQIRDQRIDNINYDSVSKRVISVFDSVKNGKKSIFIFSLLTDDFVRKIDLQQDTLISFDTNQYDKFEIGKGKDLLRLKENIIDTLFVGQKVLGCFSGYAEKIMIYKIGDHYQIIYNRNNAPSQASTKIISDILFNQYFNVFLSECCKIASPATNGLTLSNLSTTTTNTYIRHANVIYEIPDILDWKGYDAFKKRIGIIATDY